MVEIKNQPKYYVVYFITKYKTIDEVRAKAPEVITAHLERSDKLHNEGKVIMAGAFLDRPEEPVTTMAIFYTREAAEEFAKGDPFVLNGMVSKWYVREWANILKG